MNELVLFDASGNEIDSFDPVGDQDVSETTSCLIINNGAHTYVVSKDDYSTYIIREK